MTSLLIGRAPGGTLGGLYPVLDLALLVGLGYVLWGLVRTAGRLRRARSEVRIPSTTSRKTGARRLRSVFGMAVRVYLDAVVPFVILTQAPALLGAPWPVLIRVDIGVVLFVLAAIRLADGALRSTTWLVRRRAASRAMADRATPVLTPSFDR